MSLNPRITDWHEKRVWIIGASSGIGAALATQLKQEGARLAVSARREADLHKVAGEDALIMPLDVTHADSLKWIRDELLIQWGRIDMVVYCAGVYTPMRSWTFDLSVVREGLETNLQGAYNLLDAILPCYLNQANGGICLLASVAGYTGLPKALAYGPGKAALINLAQILYTDLSAKGIGVYLVNPGFVDTRLTEQNDFHMPSLLSAEQAAAEIVKGIGQGHFEIHFPRRFTYWMKLLSRLPDSLRFLLLKKAAE
ncbi:MAG: SDR family NAD(P)-dependent oxidoreductase [Candidatus Thiodiazotropha sp. (ex Ctena orbiculata)]|nr:SDR family NAD(P)-dependent oxidoreductase [Candidatus Thiodiazotropha taylori]PUB82064.1 MAG: short-chain dehydrogenase [gamma proteobacterium symbiont of Ctena orbiculata]MBT2998736.1 SDR family NAD(P)-dependent oxidoreductase [Candidatus Thiodiazotropha taylori]MBT3002347.1 SDR family NAD(P)-dependent oxidoreductase [Candidatus Thiodiazotropha taylori]MBV2108811.1 SDR family NAD(P)-dependent oxidoreductase [Candidatus Thiodiazotropha taylori]